MANNTAFTDNGSFLVNMFNDTCNDILDFLHTRFVDDELPRMSDVEYESYLASANAILDAALEEKPDEIVEWLSANVLPFGYEGIADMEVPYAPGAVEWRVCAPNASAPLSLGRVSYNVENGDNEIIAVFICREFQALAENMIG